MEEPYMSEQKAPKVKLNSRQWLAVIVCGMAYNALGILQYLARDYYVIYKEANGLTDGQMGTIMTAVGIAAVIAYFYNGFVTDLVRPKVMMMFTCSVCVVLAIILLTSPGFIPSVVCFCAFALLPMWSPMAKLLASVSTEEESNQVFAWLDFFVGLVRPADWLWCFCCRCQPELCFRCSRHSAHLHGYEHPDRCFPASH